MDVEDFKKKYEQLKDNPMYKNFCSILDTKSQVLERTTKEKQELIEYLKEQINKCKLSGNDEDYVRADVYEEIFTKFF